jgi:hypothetical protein
MGFCQIRASTVQLVGQGPLTRVRLRHVASLEYSSYEDIAWGITEAAADVWSENIISGLRQPGETLDEFRQSSWREPPRLPDTSGFARLLQAAIDVLTGGAPVAHTRSGSGRCGWRGWDRSANRACRLCHRQVDGDQQPGQPLDPDVA